MIAYDHKTPTCQGCPARVGCQDRVADLRPKVIMLLDRFNDAEGKPMSHAWLTRGERATRKRALRDESLIAVGLAHDYRDATHEATAARCGRDKIDPRTCDRNALATLSRNLGIVVGRLRSSPATLDDLAAELREHRQHTESYSMRAVRREASFLISMGRARYAGPVLELL